ncbi:uncharacterized protein LOC127417353 isoform X2 [Myxocyprinus asiaticus]|nr:uncharacterized protein LOC127417353 isoform X2 [Myxocyprinus asiaticus]XP_051513291.1 uncharacterized protein LOC127417353 isoform X2 [Myxocyprinus asiaticus]
MWVNLRSALRSLVLSLGLLSRNSEGFSLGAAVNIEPLDQAGSEQVRADYSVLSSLPCPTLDKVCNEGTCTAQLSSAPLKGLFPSPGWCLHQWQTSISSNYTTTLQLGVSLYTRADPSIRADTEHMNQPPHVALPPPIRVRAGCRQEIPVYVMDLDGDVVRCHYGRTELSQFLQLNEETCTLLYEGGAAVGQYTVEIMVEDFPQMELKPFSTVPLQLLITIESESGCPAVPEFAGVSPVGGAVFHVLPFEELQVNITVHSTEQTVSEIAVIGPEGLFISPMETVGNFQRSISLSWVRGPNQSSRLISVCFAANTQSLQSEVRCMWLQLTQMDPLPSGTELRCLERELQMSVVLPVSFLEYVPLSDLQLNDPSCPVFHNTTHITSTFSLTACGTKRLHLGSELLYTNTLRSVNPNSTISRLASLVLPLACRIPGQQARGPSFRISVPSEVEIFGAVSFWLEFHPPGEGPLATETRQPRLRTSQLVRAARALTRANRMDTLDLHVFSNCSLARAELMVGRCVESETQDFLNTQPLLNQGCLSGNSTVEILTSTPTVRVYRLYLGSLNIKGDTMFVECQVHLCVTTKQSQRCSDPCSGPADPAIIDNIQTQTYSVRSGPVLLVNKVTQTSTTTVKPSQTAKPVAQPATSQMTGITASRAPDRTALWVNSVKLAVFILASYALLP